jgi:hypothetical protein
VCHYPGLFAAFAPVIGRMNYPEKSFDHRWGSVSLGLTARNGIQIYKWNNVGWILENMRHIEMAPVVDLCGAKDGTHPFYTHSYFYHLMQKNKQAVWGKWANIGHSSGPYGNSIPGGVYRFRRNEMFPAFANASHGNSNYGHMLPADSFNIPEVDANFRFDSLGALNCQFDWSSSLRRLSFPGDSLVDSPESLRVLFVTSTYEYMVDSIRVDSARVDITPRRLQQFKINPFDKINWKNINVNSGNVVESGSVTADSFGLATIPQFLITSSANRMILEKGDNTSIVKKSGIAATISFSAYPNPFTPMVELKIDGQAAMGSINIRDVNGRIIDNVLLKSGKAVWSGGKKASGIYFAEWNDGEKVHRLKLMYMR